MKNTTHNWYDLPTYYDVSFSYDMKDELSFISNVFRKYLILNSPKLLEPACGTGRLIVPLVKKGFNCSGFDLNENALLYLKEKLNRNNLYANIKKADMSTFEVENKYDGIYCTVDTFRHLLTEKKAIQHLENVSFALKKNGIYILGLHIIPRHKKIEKIVKWTARRGSLTVNTIMSMIKLDMKRRRETLRVVLKIKKNTTRESHVSIYQLRTYTLPQILNIINKVEDLEIINTYNEYYDLSSPIILNSDSDYAVFLLRKK